MLWLGRDDNSRTSLFITEGDGCEPSPPTILSQLFVTHSAGQDVRPRGRGLDGSSRTLRTDRSTVGRHDVEKSELSARHRSPCGNLRHPDRGSPRYARPTRTGRTAATPSGSRRSVIGPRFTAMVAATGERPAGDLPHELSLWSSGRTVPVVAARQTAGTVPASRSCRPRGSRLAREGCRGVPRQARLRHDPFDGRGPRPRPDARPRQPRRIDRPSASMPRDPRGTRCFSAGRAQQLKLTVAAQPSKESIDRVCLVCLCRDLASQAMCHVSRIIFRNDLGARFG